MAGASALVAVVAIMLTAVIFRPDRAIRVATGAVADAVCAETFVSGVDPHAVFAESMDRPGIRRLRWLIRYQLDRAQKTVETSVLGCLAAAPRFMMASAASCCMDRRSPICSGATLTR